MRYSSMEEAAGQYLARMLKYACVEIRDEPCAASLCDGSAVSSHKQEISIQSLSIMWDAQINFYNFKAAMALVEVIKKHHTLADQIISFTKSEFDNNILLEIIIHAVKEKYIKKAEAIDVLAKLDNPRMTAEFLSETGNFDGKEDFKL